jgi:hypothetical protein
MKTLLLLGLVALITASSVSAAEGPVRHVVSFRFKKDAEPEKIQKVEEAFAALKGKIPAIQKLEWGRNVSPEKHDKGFTHMWILSFKTAADRDTYLVHPEHKAFASGLKDVIEDVFVIDFVPKE